MADRIFKPETLAIHAGQIPDVETGARALRHAGPAGIALLTREFPRS